MLPNIYIVNGANLNLLGVREPNIYGYQTFESFFEMLKPKFPDLTLHYFQSNHEGILLDYLHNIGFEAAGIILNAGAYTHTSWALHDAIKSITSPVIEVHISNIFSREPFRKHSCLAPACEGSISGLGLQGYELAVSYFQKQISCSIQ